MNELKSRLLRRIAQTGPMSVAAYMLECLMHPEHGYYATRDPLGAAGDFVTAPEISQMFGELIGLWMAQVWLDQGAPAPVNLVELGPGRGTLMADVLRATQAVPGFHDNLALHLVEASPVLRDVQARVLAPWAPQFHDTVATVPDGPLFLVANEFFDALPIRQFQRAASATWQERMIGCDGDALVWGLAPPTPVAALSHRVASVAPGQIVEVNASGEAVAADIGERIARFGGAALVIDYGDWDSIGDTFQAVRAHKSVDVLSDPGSADLTAHVAFRPLAAAAGPGLASGLVTQGVFLERLGIAARAEQLLRSLSGSAAENHIAAHRRLTHPDEMGHLFKVLALWPEDRPRPPALE